MPEGLLFPGTWDVAPAHALLIPYSCLGNVIELWGQEKHARLTSLESYKLRSFLAVGRWLTNERDATRGAEDGRDGMADQSRAPLKLCVRVKSEPLWWYEGTLKKNQGGGVEVRNSGSWGQGI